jgi:hypothetical protein
LPRHDPEKCAAVFRKACLGLDPRDHAQTGSQSAMTIHPQVIHPQVIAP